MTRQARLYAHEFGCHVVYAISSMVLFDFISALGVAPQLHGCMFFAHTNGLQDFSVAPLSTRAAR